jgi:flavin reductase (DIM6/NTAB) family NADH-FMN oxidoreductase RutF
MDHESKKRVLRSIPYGLYALGVRRGERPHMMTVSWVTQVSFEPPMLAVAIERDARALEMIRDAQEFVISVFPTGARQLAGKLGRSSANVPDKMDGVAHRPAPISGAPILRDCTGWLECHVSAEQPAGDHIVFIADVVEAGVSREAETLTLKETGFRYAG